MTSVFEQRLSQHYEALSARLRQAADYVAANKVAVATRSLRAVASESALPPATFSRLSRALGYSDFEEMREEMRRGVSARVSSFSERAERLQSAHSKSSRDILDLHLEACVNNIRELAEAIDQDELAQTVDRLHAARRVLLVGNLGSTGVVEYLTYQMNFIAENWSMAGRMGASVGSSLVDLDASDALLVVTKPPFAKRGIHAARMASEQGAFVVVISDTYSCPAFRHASARFVVPTDSPNFFSSYTATLVLVETIAGMLVAKAGRAANLRIAAVEERNRRLEEVWDG